MSVADYVAVAAVLIAGAFSILTWWSVRRQQTGRTSTEDRNLPVEIARLQERERNATEDAARLRTASAQFEAELSLLRQSCAEAREKLAASQTAEAELRTRIERAEAYIADRDEKVRGLELLLKEVQEKVSRRDAENAAAREKLSALEAAVAEKRQELETLQQRLTTEFENVATKVLRANASELSESSQRQLDTILNPLRDRIKEFEGKVESTYETEKRDVLALKEQIRIMVEASQSLGSRADALAKALKGDVQMLGRWGELVLERILEAAGLVEGREYVTQGRELGLRNEEGGIQRPDVLIRLPENRTMVIDSKVSLASYDRLIAAKEESERQEYGRQFVRDVKAHIDGLSQKRYQDNEQIMAHDCVLMFVPIEGALAAALTADPELLTHSWEKRVVLVGPSTLLMTLRTVASLWRYEHQNRNAQAIASEAGKLHDKLVASIEDLNEVSDKIRKAASAHDSAMRKLAHGKGNALSRANRMKSMGAPAKKEIPLIVIDGEKHAVDEDDDEETATVMPAQRLVAPEG
jgi:DNA recombination protein RmuC